MGTRDIVWEWNKHERWKYAKIKPFDRIDFWTFLIGCEKLCSYSTEMIKVVGMQIIFYA